MVCAEWDWLIHVLYVKREISEFLQGDRSPVNPLGSLSYCRFYMVLIYEISREMQNSM